MDSPNRELSPDTQVCGFPLCGWLSVPPSSHFRYLDNISGTVGPFCSFSHAINSPRQALSNGTQVYMVPIDSWPSRAGTTLCFSSPPTPSGTPCPELILGLFCSDLIPFPSPTFAFAINLVVFPESGILWCSANGWQPGTSYVHFAWVCFPHLFLVNPSSIHPTPQLLTPTPLLHMHHPIDQAKYDSPSHYHPMLYIDTDILVLLAHYQGLTT